MPHSSFRPKKSEAPRWGQWLPMRPTWPLVSRKATSSSPSSFTRTGGPSGLGSSVESSAGVQYCRMSSPIGVPGPTRVSSSFSSFDSIRRLLLHLPIVDVPAHQRVEGLRVDARDGRRVGRNVVVEVEHDERQLVADQFGHL